MWARSWPSRRTRTRPSAGSTRCDVFPATVEEVAGVLRVANERVPPDPGSQSTATIGGDVAERAGGLRAVEYGLTRDYMPGVGPLLPTGESICSGGRLVKDAADCRGWWLSFSPGVARPAIVCSEGQSREEHENVWKRLSRNRVGRCQ